ncbi:MAG: MFS transporter [Deltaproteobacteria bacterium]|nr:MFS transporter [Deltaproteobacteria bacterium]
MTDAIPPEFSQPGYRSRRVQNWVLLGLLYALFYMTRYNYTAVNPHIAEILGWKNTELGVFETVMPLVYGLSVFFNGPLADRVGGKRAFLFGGLGVFVMNVVFGCSALFVERPAVWAGTGQARAVVEPAVLGLGLSGGALLALMATVWGINGYFQSFGALAIVKVNAQWFHMRERGTFSGIFGVLIRLGLWLGFSISPLLIGLRGGLWQWAFWIPAVCVLLFVLLNWRLMENAPTDAGFAGIDTGDEAAPDDGKPVKTADVLRKVFTSKAAWMIAVCSMMIGLVRRSVVDAWYPKYFADMFGVPKASLGTFLPYQVTSTGIALLGILGGFAFGISSDRIYKGRRAPVIVYGFAGMALMLVALGLVHRAALGPWATMVCLVLLSFCVNGAHGMVGGAASMDFGGRKAAATAAGLFDGMQYLAAAVVGVGVGRIVDNWGWGVWMWAPIPFAVIGVLVMAQLWNVTPRGRGGH